ncbi:NAD(P)H-dependent glycerol-3-phosphate dehydrogenase [Bradyrhizobium sp. LHD-71]|uniref:NAD(P)H-dependent glycerol-3-phosphate dehydrogenase n=1 Tax=Bradyrhizobium sp. LHD-71 TaxID=3072141 RepID=UPI00280C65E7|nr:NAD(P)H-dependent glycerol-3-phosphate dehydrogenase [Bradyrhizobium sp. LHD-71]MDQ8729682.1 NAD(P)H-dependent glycerol-3-phosphate dehydrogenase [Bradyrhizobium sp. LHD-71]
MAAHKTIAVIGAGAWGTALANAVANPERTVILYARDGAAAERIATSRFNPKLPGIRVNDDVILTADIARAATAGTILIAVPAQNLREAIDEMAPHLAAGTSLVATAKGIERGTHKFMTEILGETAPRAVAAILSGPSFAQDIARGLPTAITIAAKDAPAAAALAYKLGTPAFRPYHTTDVRGVEIGGAAKNVFAIAAGIVIGRKLGASALAALTTRGFAELMRFGEAFGARPETLTGLSGLGDLILSCSSPQSRNLSFGIGLGEGKSLSAATGGRLVEGAFTAQVLLEMAKARAVDMPVTEAVTAVLGGQLSVKDAIDMLLMRPFKAEA